MVTKTIIQLVALAALSKSLSIELDDTETCLYETQYVTCININVGQCCDSYFAFESADFTSMPTGEAKAGFLFNEDPHYDTDCATEQYSGLIATSATQACLPGSSTGLQYSGGASLITCSYLREQYMCDPSNMKRQLDTVRELNIDPNNSIRVNATCDSQKPDRLGAHGMNIYIGSKSEVLKSHGLSTIDEVNREELYSDIKTMTKADFWKKYEQFNVDHSGNKRQEYHDMIANHKSG